MNIEECMSFINSYTKSGGRITDLSRAADLMERIGDPQKRLKFVHIAGTNGKGSTLEYIANALQFSGYKTGKFTSPFILRYNDRIRINDDEIDEESLCSIAEFVKERVGDMAYSQFEITMAIALLWYEREKCDIVVLETGIGGLLDCTNVIPPPLISVITSISLDHTAVLGDTLEKIAYEKSGIIKMGRAVVYNRQEECVNSVIENEAEKKGCKVYIPYKAEMISTDIHGSVIKYRDKELFLSLPGQHQLKNVSLVLRAVDVLRDLGIEISDEAVKNGISSVKIPARFECVSDDPLIILDGAHNPGGLQALSDSIDRYLYDKKIICIMGMLKDKDCKSSLKALKGKLYKVITTQINDNPRKLSSEELKAIAGEYFCDITAESDVKTAVLKAVELANSTENPAVLVCGSLYLAAQIREFLCEGCEQHKKGRHIY